MQKKRMNVFFATAALMLSLMTVYKAEAGDLDPPAAPTASESAMYTLGDLYNLLNEGTPALKRTGGFIEPGSAPAPTMATLDEIYALGFAASFPAPVPRTGSDRDYYSGEDGNLKKGTPWPSPRLTDNGNGTVTDNLTGLVWLQNADCFGELAWADALTAAGGLDAPECGLSDGSAEGDWRLPNVHELTSLVDFGQSSPALPSGHPFSSVQISSYWTSTSYPSLAPNAWRVMFVSGAMGFVTKTNLYYTWPVRGGPAAGEKVPAPVARTGQTVSKATGDDGDLQKGAVWPSPRFTDNGDGTVTDRLTGLVWLEDANCFGVLSWQNALAAANGLNSGECGLSDGSAEGAWRLANVNELVSLTDFSEYDLALQDGHPFDNVAGTYYWSSTRRDDNSIAAWCADILSGSTTSDVIDNEKVSWPVRGGL